MKAVRFNLEYTIDGTVLDGMVTRRQYAVAEARIVMHLDLGPLPILGVLPDIAQYSFDDEWIEIAVPLVLDGWHQLPLRLDDNPRLRRACETGEIGLRIVTPVEERVLRVTHEASARWSSRNPDLWSPPTERDRLLIQVGRDGELNMHPNASKVRAIGEAGDECLVPLSDLVLPRRSTCIFCDAPDPDSMEHAVPAWATAAGETGITVASCTRCNNRLAFLESAVADISRRNSTELSPADTTLIWVWAAKTIWVIGKALDVDPLCGFGDDHVAGLVEMEDRDQGPAEFVLDGVRVSIDGSESGNFIRYSGPDAASPWAMLRVGNTLVSIWLAPSDAADRA